MKFSIKDFFSKFDKIRRKLRIQSNLLYLCSVSRTLSLRTVVVRYRTKALSQIKPKVRKDALFSYVICNLKKCLRDRDFGKKDFTASLYINIFVSNICNTQYFHDSMFTRFALMSHKMFNILNHEIAGKGIYRKQQIHFLIIYFVEMKEAVRIP